jgi:hypothetical protein
LREEAPSRALSVLPHHDEHIYQGDYRQAHMSQNGIGVIRALIGLLRAGGDEMRNDGEQQHSTNLGLVADITINVL